MEAKQLKLTFLLAVLMSMVGAKAFAHDIEVANADGVTIYYKLINNSTEVEVSYRGSSFSSYSNEYSGVVNIPASVTYNGMTYPVTSIGESAFDKCTSLTSVTIPNSVTSIGNGAFYVCRGLTTVTIPNSVTSIGDYAFSRCTGLTSVTIPNSVTSIGDGAFYFCSDLTEINVDENNTAYSSIDGVLFNKSQTELILYPRRKQGTYTIPNSVTSIGDRAFRECTGLTSVTIPNSVTSIGICAFYRCSGLTEINVDENNSTYSSIDGVLFNKSQTGLIQYPGGKQGAYTIPNSVTSIGESAFEGCIGLTSVSIPNSVVSIEEFAFGYYTGLTDIYCHIEEPLTIASSVFDYFNTCTLHVPIGSKVKYQAADVWKNFLNIVEDLPTGIVSIDHSQSTIDNDVWFTLNGVRLNGKPTRNGVYLVKYNNGNIRKVMIK